MSVFARVRMPSLGGATGWLDTDPLGPAGCAARRPGRLLDAELHQLAADQEPYVKAWARAYRDDGLVVVGVHTPEFPFEHDITSCAGRWRTRTSTTPSRSTTATPSGTPSTTTTGRPGTSSTGKARSATTSTARGATAVRALLQKLLRHRARARRHRGRRRRGAGGLGAAAHPGDYLGYARGERFASRVGEDRAVQIPDGCGSTTGRSTANGRSATRTSRSTARAAASPSASRPGTPHRCSARLGRADRVPRAPRRRATGPVARRGRRRGRQRGARDGRMYQPRPPERRGGERTLKITFLQPGAEAYSFTFG